MEKMASRKASPLHITHRRMVVSMPNLQDISLPELPPRNSSLRIMDTSSCKSSSPGEVASLLRLLCQRCSVEIIAGFRVSACVYKRKLFGPGMMVNACNLSSLGVWGRIGACEFKASLGFKLSCVNMVITRLRSCLR